MSLSIIRVLICLYVTSVTANTESKSFATDRHVPSPEAIFQLTKRLDEMTKHVEDLKRFRDSDTREMAKMNEQLQRLQTLRANDQHVMIQLTRRIAELEHLRDKDQYKTTQLTMRVTELEREYNRGGQVISDGPNPITLDKHGTSLNVVAFQAFLAQTLNGPATAQTIKYNKLFTSTSGAQYSTNTGVFTCTQAGVYVFSWSILVRAPKFVYTELVRNHDVVGRSLAGDHVFDSHSASTVVVHLEIGDEVWVRLSSSHSDSVVILSNASMFSGFRLN